jgi:glutamine amidotransferase
MIGILDYGMGNVRSVQKAMEFIGQKAIVSGDTATLDGCSRLILPGVGSFGQGMQELKKRGLDTYVKARAKDTPMLGICLGMQFLLEKSYEDGENEGLGFCKGEVVKFTQGKVPQIGWNEVFDLRSPLFENIPENSSFYFVHSYHARTSAEFSIATCNYYEDYAAAVWNGKNVFGTQFHPEKSGDVGLELLRNFVRI